MGEVVKLKAERETLYWRCACGCLTHYVREDGEIECAHCKVLADGTGTWRTPAPDDPEPREFDPNDPAKIVVDLEGAEATIKRVLRMNPEDLAALVILLKDGMVKVWGPDFTSRAERGWIRRKLEIARRVLTLADADDGPG